MLIRPEEGRVRGGNPRKDVIVDGSDHSVLPQTLNKRDQMVQNHDKNRNELVHKTTTRVKVGRDKSAPDKSY